LIGNWNIASLTGKGHALIKETKLQFLNVVDVSSTYVVALSLYGLSMVGTWESLTVFECWASWSKSAQAGVRTFISPQCWWMDPMCAYWIWS